MFPLELFLYDLICPSVQAARRAVDNCPKRYLVVLTENTHPHHVPVHWTRPGRRRVRDGLVQDDLVRDGFRNHLVGHLAPKPTTLVSVLLSGAGCCLLRALAASCIALAPGTGQSPSFAIYPYEPGSKAPTGTPDNSHIVPNKEF